MYAIAYPGAATSLLIGASPGVRSPEKSDLERSLAAGRNPLLVRNGDDFDALMAAAYSVSLFTDWQARSFNQVWLKERIASDSPASAPAEFYGAVAASQALHPIESMPVDGCTPQHSVPGPWHLRGKLRADARPAEALADFDRFLQLADHPEVRQLRGYCLLQLDRADDALPELERAAPSPYTDYLRAWAFAAVGNADESVRAMAACVAGDPGFANYFHDLDDFAVVRQHPGFATAVPR